jgi:hypothetical protein
LQETYQVWKILELKTYKLEVHLERNFRAKYPHTSDLSAFSMRIDLINEQAFGE